MNNVMWQIRRIRLDRVGAPASRFLDVTIDLADGQGLPLDSILWLRNGGGKSTVLSLVCAVIRPHRRDFLATSTTDKHLEDYVLGADTAHLTIEWSGPAGRRLVTGAVYEWADRTQPADPNRDHDKLEARWYVFTPVPGRAEFELLPFTANGQPLPLKEFAAAVRAWDAIAGCGATVAEGQDRWTRVLDDHGLDPDLFTAILQMNATEGGIEGQFQFRNADAFVRYLLQLIVDPDVPRSVSQILESVRAALAERPALLADLTFADEAVPQLRRLAAARDEYVTAVELLTEAQNGATRLRERLVAAAQRAASERDEYATTAKAEADRAVSERRAGDLVYNRSVELRRIAASYRHDAAVVRRDTLDELLEAAQAERDAWRAVPRLHALAAAQRRVRELDGELRAAMVDAEPLREQRDAAAAAFAAALDATVDELTDQIDALTVHRDEQAERAAEAKALSAEKAEERGRKESRLASLIELLEALDAAIEAAVTDEHIEAGEDVPAAISRHRTDDGSAEQRLATLADDRHALLERRDALGTRERELDAHRAEVSVRRQTAVDARDALLARIDALSSEERLRLLAETDDLDVLAEATDLHALLTEQVTRADRRRVEIAVAGAEDNRAAAALAATGLLPPVLDVALALAECEKAPIAVTSGWAYLADSVPAHLRAKVLATAPALAGGVLVHNPTELTAAQELLRGARLRPTSAVTVATTADLHAVVEQVSSDAATPAMFVIPTAPALTDRAAAGDELRLRDIARGDRAEEAETLERQRDADDELRRTLRVLLADCPPGTLDALEAGIGESDGRLDTIDAELAAVPDQRTALDAEAAELDQAAAVAQRTRLTLQRQFRVGGRVCGSGRGGLGVGVVGARWTRPRRVLGGVCVG